MYQNRKVKAYDPPKGIELPCTSVYLGMLDHIPSALVTARFSKFSRSQLLARGFEITQSATVDLKP